MMEKEGSFPTEEELSSHLQKTLDLRSLLAFRLSGGAKFLTDQLNQQYQKIQQGRNPSASSSGEQGGIENTLLRLLSLLVSFCRDYDFAADFATVGGHMLLKKMLTSDCITSDTMDEVENVVGSIALSGCVFPMKGILSDGTTESIVRTTACTLTEGTKQYSEGSIGGCKGESAIANGGKEEENDGQNSCTKGTMEYNETEYNNCNENNDCNEKEYNEYNQFTVHLRSIPQSIYGTGQHAVGYLLWSSAVILSRFIVQNEELIIRNKNVLECGAGLGLCGIVAGRYAAAVTLTDFSEILVQNLQYNIQINQGPEVLEGCRSCIADKCTIDSYIIDWNVLTISDNKIKAVDSTKVGRINEEGINDSASIIASMSKSDIDVTATINTAGVLSVNSVMLSETDESVPRYSTNNSIEKIEVTEDIIDIKDIKVTLNTPLNRKYDVIIGSDLVYCESDNTGILKLVTNYLSENGIFVFVVPKPRHRYGTEFLVPVLEEGGFEVYSRCIAHSGCTSGEVEGENGVRLSGCWKAGRSNDYLDSNCSNGASEEDEGMNGRNDKEDREDRKDKFLFNDKYFSDLLDTLIFDNDHLVSRLDEHPFIAWDFIIGHRR